MSNSEKKWGDLSEDEQQKAFKELDLLARRREQQIYEYQKKIKKRIQKINGDFPRVRI